MMTKVWKKDGEDEIVVGFQGSDYNYVVVSEQYGMFPSEHFMPGSNYKQVWSKDE